MSIIERIIMLNELIKPFHFIDPLWLLGLIPALLIVWKLLRYRDNHQSSWDRVIDKKFLAFMVVKSPSDNQTRTHLVLILIAWIVAIIALANPTWERLPQPVFQQLDAQVIVLDLSPAMLAKDIKPSRMAQAKYKIIDILDHSQGKQTGLIVYSGDAFTVTPLTDDISTIKSQLRVLEPSLMPAIGNRADLGLQQAGKLLSQAGYMKGHIILIAENGGNENSRNTADKLAKKGYQISVLGMGNKTGAPIPGYRNADGQAVLSKLDSDGLSAISKKGHGIYVQFTSSMDDVNQLVNINQLSKTSLYQGKAKHKQAERWVQEGPWLTLLLLPLALLGFRRGWFLVLPFMMVVPILNPTPVMASGWDDLWQRPDQQSAKAFSKKDYTNAASLATDPKRQGSALYRAGKYKEAIKSFSHKKDANSAYNLGNTLAHTGDYKKALDAYDKALNKQPEMQDAIENRKLVEKLLKKQEQQKKKQQQQKQKNSENKKKQNKNNKQNQNKDNKGKKSSDQQKQANNSNNKGQSKQNQKDNKKNKALNESQQEKNNKSKEKKQDKQQASGSKQNKEKDKNQKNNASNEQDKRNEKSNKKDDHFSSADTKKQQKYADKTVNKSNEKKAQQKNSEKPMPDQASVNQDKLSPEERQSVENWLRRVPDDPGGLLRRKFLYQYQQRNQIR